MSAARGEGTAVVAGGANGTGLVVLWKAPELYTTRDVE